VVRREADGLHRYVHVSTGNYNANTARLYEDVGLLTANPDIASDVTDLFNELTGYAEHEQYRTLWVAPDTMRQRLLAAIEREIEKHRENGNGHLIFKFNSLVDRRTIRALYAASHAGVKIDLIVRGICCLRPGVPGWSETIRVISVVGRFLEHSRIYAFRNGGEWEIFIGSADLMERNFDQRVEAIAPVFDKTLAKHLRERVLDAYLRDTVNTRELQPDGSYKRVGPEKGAKPFDVQAWLTAEYHKGPVGGPLV
jgi:polyphosphate kinase